MKQKLLLILSFVSAISFGQMVNDFEPGSEGLLNTFRLSTSVVANPNPSGINTTQNCLEMRRIAGNSDWFALAGINVDDLTISSSDTKFISAMVLYTAQPDIGVRLNAPDDNSNGVANANNPVVRPLNKYDASLAGEWQEIVIEIKDNGNAQNFSSGTLFRITFHPDMGFENDPAGQILNDTDIFGYIDEIRITDTNTLSSEQIDQASNISISPNPTASVFNIRTRNDTAIAEVSVIDLLGKNVSSNVNQLSNNRYDVSSLSSGIYIVKITDSNGNLSNRRLIKK